MNSHLCIIPVYCYMPDHQHLIISDTDVKAEHLKIYQSLMNRKLVIGSPDAHQRLFGKKIVFDHIIRKRKVWSTSSKYILDNTMY